MITLTSVLWEARLSMTTTIIRITNPHARIRRISYAIAIAFVPVNAQTFQPLRFAGVNIAGFDFGCGTDGTCNITQACPPLTQLGCADGLGQMQHFIIGQGGPSNEIFAELWYNIADYWKNESRIIFGVMNEPHDIPNIMIWAGSVQAAVTAIHSTGASSQIILLPGNNYTSTETFIPSDSAAALNMVRNPDGSITNFSKTANISRWSGPLPRFLKNLVMDVHKYLDYGNS
ncbi:hypothetical protein J3R83DRAFT_10459 [Lanmaoa asiatica]|nr:hypothetical protein J3R83DRAFT_10459 [Lanmaoa asiatica]